MKDALDSRKHREMVSKMTIALLLEYPNAAVEIADRQIGISDTESRAVWIAIKERLIDLATRP